MKPSNPLRQWGAPIILVVLALTFNVIHYSSMRDRSIHEAEKQCELLSEITGDEFPVSKCYEESEFRTEFIETTAENMQSEMWQLAVDSLLIAAAALVIFRKNKDDSIETLTRLRRIEKHLGSESQEVETP